MKYMIASDIHGSSYYCQKLMDAYKYEKPDRLILNWFKSQGQISDSSC